jgi:DNA-binding MarR family transcriptional regulator
MSELPADPPEVEIVAATDFACFGASLRRTANLVTRIYNAWLAPSGLEVTQYSILRKIQTGAAGSASELADIVGVERSTLTRNLERLVRLGLIEARSGAGRRLVHVLTPEGEARVAIARPLWNEAQRALVEAMPTDRAPLVLDELAMLRKAARAAQPR